jgi:dienelactone hydrolase
VTVTASSLIDGSVHEASAIFTADHTGVVDTARHASTAGSYTGTDPFGLWWSATPAGPAAHAGTPPGPVTTRLWAETTGGPVTAEFQRHWLAAGATVTEVREPGVHGIFARPAGPGPFPGVVAFGGSGGGLGPAAAWAPVLASHGLATLAIAYFGGPGLPDALVGIEVEVVERAARWLLRGDDVAPGTVGVMGVSRGSELALWAGALLDTIGAVAAFAPSGVSWAGLDAGGPRDGGHTSAGVPGTPVVTEARRHPLTGASYSFGGTRAGNAHARADSWPRVVAFLRDALG